MIEHYILVGQEPRLVEWSEWAKWDESADTQVALDTVGEVEVSTVFLGNDHRIGENKPILFETMVFGGSLDKERNRYSTWTEAKQGHAAMLARVRGTESG